MKPMAARLAICGAILMGSSAVAQSPEFPVGECAPLSFAPNGDALAYCEMKNPGDAPIARVKAQVSLKHPAHEAPMASHVVEFTVPGGIAAGGFNSIPFPHQTGVDLPASPKFKTLVQVIDVWDYEGRRVYVKDAYPEKRELKVSTGEVSRTPVAKANSKPAAPARKVATSIAPQAAPEKVAAKVVSKAEEKSPSKARWAQLSDTDRRVLAEGVKACWNVNARSAIADIDLMVQFSLDEDGQLIGDVETIRASDADERVVWDAYMAARRAVLRCQGNGFPIAAPAENIRMMFAGGNKVEVL